MSKGHIIRLGAALIACWGWGSILAGSYEQADFRADSTAEQLNVDYNSGQWPVALPKASLDEIIVKFQPDVSPADRRHIVQQSGCSTGRQCDPGQFQLVRILPEETPERIIEIFQAHQAVQYAEPDYFARATFLPDDSFFSFQWNLGNATTGGIQMEAAWDIQQGDPNVIVAILDTGVAYEDFDSFVQAPDLAHTAFVPGYDFVNDDSHPNDDQGHGTHVCGTIAQSTNNGMGVAGVAFGCSIMPVKVLGADGIGDHFAIAQGIYFAIEHGARVINMSLGGPDDSQTLRAAVAEAHRQGITFVCAAGNEFQDGSPTAYPAAYDDFCIAVGAVRYDMTRAPYSSVGVHVDVVAPGGDLSVDQNDDGYVDGILQQTFVDEPGEFAYWFFQGTSMAAPHVAGLAALVASRGITDPNEIRAAIEATAVDLGAPGWDAEYGWGIIDAAAAMAFHE
jgi:serine protease